MNTTIDPASWGGQTVQPGQRKTIAVRISESYSGVEVRMPIHVWRGKDPGPTVFITAAVHGDELNGTGTIRKIVRDRPFDLVAGTLVMVPVVNILGFEWQSRYLPDRRDLNRSFPGSAEGSVAGRLAKSVFDLIISRCDYGIDLHTAAVRRTNFPNIRADMENEKLVPFARAAGAELIVDGAGPDGSLRASACSVGCATFTLEAGEVWKVEPSIVEYALRGITNCLKFLGMVEGQPIEPAYRIETDATKWVRAHYGGFLDFHVAPGDSVQEGDPIATNSGLTGEYQNIITSPRDGIVLGMTTLPSVAPGDPICHIAYTAKGSLSKIEQIVDAMHEDTLHERLRDDLSRNLSVTEPEEPQ